LPPAASTFLRTSLGQAGYASRDTSRPVGGTVPDQTAGVNKAHALTRRRFTIAHECAHALLHEGREVRYDTDFRVDFRSGMSALGVDVEEMEANFFAACILMPRRFLEADPLISELDVEDAAPTVKALAARYKVSTQAMSIRLGNLAARPGSYAKVPS
jgi:Zn-dependent peptidase ImmA (M78 family)